LGVARRCGQYRNRLGEAFWPDIVERRRLHAALLLSHCDRRQAPTWAAFAAFEARRSVLSTI
jgi:hypothetical protein